MKLIGIGDLFIPCEYIQTGLRPLEACGVEAETVEWRLESFDQLQELNLKIEKGGSEAVEPPAYLLEKMAQAEILITHFCPITRAVIDACPRLKIIGVLRGGYENVNVAYAKQKGIQVFNTPGRNADSVADFTVGMAIAECRNIAKGHHGLKNGEWIRRYPNVDTIPDLPGRTFGIIGLGEIGQKVARRLAGFEMTLLGFDPFVDPQRMEPYNVTVVSLEELLRKSDFVSLHARLTGENAGLIGERELSWMKPSAYLINTARAALIDEKALYQALKNHQIAGAALDVFETEPPGKDYPLVTLENVTLTPHMAGGSRDAFLNTPKRLAADLANHLTGKPARFLIH